MRYVRLLVALLVMAGVAFGGDATTSVGVSSVKLLGDSGAKNAAAWVAGATVGAGQLVKSNGTIYMALAAGTTGATAPYGVARDVSDGTITWRPVLANARQGLTVSNNGSGTVTLSWFDTAVAGRGMTLLKNCTLVLTGPECPRGPVYAISTASTNSLGTVEW